MNDSDIEAHTHTYTHMRVRAHTQTHTNTHTHTLPHKTDFYMCNDGAWYVVAACLNSFILGCSSLL